METCIGINRTKYNKRIYRNAKEVITFPNVKRCEFMCMYAYNEEKGSFIESALTEESMDIMSEEMISDMIRCIQNHYQLTDAHVIMVKEHNDAEGRELPNIIKEAVIKAETLKSQKEDYEKKINQQKKIIKELKSKTTLKSVKVFFNGIITTVVLIAGFIICVVIINPTTIQTIINILMGGK